ncbi:MULTISPECIES: hypothetical protein [Alcaligenaceae]|uniref:StbC n=1 Tax=Pollutimonas thiosulfatoxidans TaxID=2028345 RepID=A0A410GDQ0_9BURK|nr:MULTISPECIES: hypothetical protein [Alcaligenaceae]QAA94404.1 hypothetical protein CKA81_11585 [Pollutimonas thiosulfatoxidans]WJJ94391.1 hypothetical protein N7E01_05145 [Neopusillimonas aromaticivorans]
MDAHTPPSGPRSKLDLLYHEVLGEVAGLVDRLEAVTRNLNAAQQQMQSMSEAQQMLPQQLGRHLSATLEAASKPVNLQLQQSLQSMLSDTGTRLDQLSRESAQYARIAHQSARRMAFIALVVGGTAGVLGGLLAGLALGQLLIP